MSVFGIRTECVMGQILMLAFLNAGSQVFSGNMRKRNCNSGFNDKNICISALTVTFIIQGLNLRECVIKGLTLRESVIKGFDLKRKCNSAFDLKIMCNSGFDLKIMCN